VGPLPRRMASGANLGRRAGCRSRRGGGGDHRRASRVRAFDGVPGSVPRLVACVSLPRTRWWRRREQGGIGGSPAVKICGGRKRFNTGESETGNEGGRRCLGRAPCYHETRRADEEAGGGRRRPKSKKFGGGMKEESTKSPSIGAATSRFLA
jgi:hypothetical protein